MGSRPNTPILRYSNTPFRSHASPLDLFEQPANGFFSSPLVDEIESMASKLRNSILMMHENKRVYLSRSSLTSLHRFLDDFPMWLATLLIFLAASFFGCVPKQQNETIAGVVVPIPAPMKKLPASEEQVDLGLEQKGEQVSFRGEVSSSEIVRFYHDVLPAGDWQPNSVLGAEIGGYAFTRDNQTIAIRVTENDSKTSTLTVLVKAGEFKPAAP